MILNPVTLTITTHFNLDVYESNFHIYFFAELITLSQQC